MIREAQPEDAPGIARVHVDSWRTTYAGIVPADYLAALSYENSEQNWSRGLSNPERRALYFVAADDAGQVVGFICGGPNREGHPRYASELYAIYLLQAAQGKGIGRGLTAALVRQLLERGFESMIVWVLADNPFRKFYEALGGQFVTLKEFELGGTTLTEAGYGWADLRLFK